MPEKEERMILIKGIQFYHLYKSECRALLKGRARFEDIYLFEKCCNPLRGFIRYEMDIDCFKYNIRDTYLTAQKI